MDIEKEIDYRIQRKGFRLGQEDAGMRDRIRRDLEWEEEWRKLHPRPESPRFVFPPFKGY